MRALAILVSLAGFVDADYFQLRHENGECKSDDVLLGTDVPTLEACAQKCLSRGASFGFDGQAAGFEECKFFIYGFGSRQGKCFMEKTSYDALGLLPCPQGWAVKDYNFYEITDRQRRNYPYPPPPPPSPSAPPPPPLPPPSPHPPPTPRYELKKSDAECDSNDVYLGHADTVGSCADLCASSYDSGRECRFFIYGKGYKHGSCWMEMTNTSSCVEGWEADEYDFYELHAGTCHQNGVGCVRGCTDARDTEHYDPKANVDDGSCTGVSACLPSRKDEGACATCTEDQVAGRCLNGTKQYRTKSFDQIVATRVDGGHITVDGSLRDWHQHSAEMCYKDVPFADKQGREVTFETYGGGKWFGESDFSVKFMLSWDDTHFYLAAEVGRPRHALNTRPSQPRVARLAARSRLAPRPLFRDLSRADAGRSLFRDCTGARRRPACRERLLRERAAGGLRGGW